MVKPKTDLRNDLQQVATFPFVLRRGPWVDLAFWIAYGLFWHVIFSPVIFSPPNLAISAILTFWQAVASYTHQRYLLQPRADGLVSLFWYVIGVLAVVALCSALSGGSVYAFFVAALDYESTLDFLESFWDYWVGSILGGMTMAVALMGAIFLFGRRRDQQKREQQLEHARVNTELAYLRGQLNPHFLFNALNSIYVLIPRSPDQAQEALGGFSDLLRYQLYRSEQTLVPLEEELTHLHQFVALSRLRLEADFTFNLKVVEAEQVRLAEQQIPPLLLLPLIENALKYCPSQGGEVTGILTVTAQKMLFILTNNVGVEVIAKDAAAGGIGLANIRRRLELLFPDRHRLETLAKNQHFTVTLEIPLP